MLNAEQAAEILDGMVLGAAMEGCRHSESGTCGPCLRTARAALQIALDVLYAPLVPEAHPSQMSLLVAPHDQ